MNIEETVAEKSKLLLQLHTALQGKARRDKVDLASRAAALESFVAEHYLTKADYKNAVISLNSEASCLAIAERWKEAFRVFCRSLSLSPPPRMAAWIHQQIAAIPNHATFVTPVQAFARPASIESNKLLRRPQIGAYLAARRHFASGSGHAIIQLPVGCGKTGTMAILPFQLAQGRVLVVAPNLEIARNLHASLDYSSPRNFLKRTRVLSNGIGPSCAVLDSAASLFDSDASDFIVTNIQQLVARNSAKWLTRLPTDYFDLLLIDEGHHNVAPSWTRAIEYFQAAKVVSFTATPLRSDGQPVEGTRIYHFPIADAIREGYIKDIASRRLEPSEIYFTYRGEERRHSLAEVASLRERDWFSKGVALSTECNRNIVDASIKCMSDLREQGTLKHQIIAAACSIDHAKAVRSLYTERGLAAEVIHSDLPDDEQQRIRLELEGGRLDVIVHVAMLGEGADYPLLGVAAIFRPYRHLVPYVQFVGRVMRVNRENAAGHPDNHGYVVSHFGLNIDRWWQELQELDSEDREFYKEIANGWRSFEVDEPEDIGTPSTEPRRRFTPEMRVLEETIDYFVQSGFLPEDSDAIVDDLIHAMELRGLGPDVLGISRDEMVARVLASQQAAERRGKHEPLPVQPQLARQEARKRLGERVRSAAKQLLNDLGLSVNGFELVRGPHKTGSKNNLSAAIILLNREVQAFLGVDRAERDLLSQEECQKAHDSMDEIIDALRKKIEGP